MALRLGIIGCGNITINAHLPAAQAGLPAEQAATDWRAVVGRPEVDAVVVATPQRARPEIAITAAHAGKHLFCEKPLALTPAAAHEMVRAASEAGVVFATVHNYVFMPVYRDLKQVAESGEIGRLETVTLNFLGVEDRPGTAAYRPRWRHDARESGGGVLMDMLHAVYLGGWLLGEQRPTAVGAFVDRRLGGEGDVEDYALVRYDYPGGHAMINMAWGKGPGGVELAGTAGRAILINEGFGTHPFVPPEKIVVVGDKGRREVVPDRSLGYGHRASLENFRDAVLGGAAPIATGEDGVAVLEAVVGAYKAGAMGVDVRLPLERDDPVFQQGASGIASLPLPPDSPVRRRGLFGVGAAGRA